MPTKLTKPVSRITAKEVSGRPIIVTIAPAGSQPEALIGLRQVGRRTEYIVALSDVYRWAALAYGQKMARAKKEARKHGISWRVAKKQFQKDNRIPKHVDL